MAGSDGGREPLFQLRRLVPRMRAVVPVEALALEDLEDLRLLLGTDQKTARPTREEWLLPYRGPALVPLPVMRPPW